jgi:hypothetical protein
MAVTPTNIVLSAELITGQERDDEVKTIYMATDGPREGKCPSHEPCIRLNRSTSQCVRSGLSEMEIIMANAPRWVAHPRAVDI